MFKVGKVVLTVFITRVIAVYSNCFNSLLDVNSSFTASITSFPIRSHEVVNISIGKPSRAVVLSLGIKKTILLIFDLVEILEKCSKFYELHQKRWMSQIWVKVDDIKRRVDCSEQVFEVLGIGYIGLKRI